MLDIKINNRVIGEKHPAYIIAEIGLNHQGDIDLAKKLIDIAIEAKSDCVKFQKRSLSQLYKKEVLEHPEEQQQGINYLFNHIKKCEFSDEDMRELHRYSVQRNIDFICTPWDEDSLKFLSELNLPAYKIGSPDFLNLPLIQHITQLKKPIIISTGMSFLSEITQVVEFLNNINAKYILLHCNSTYPASYYDINLNFIKKLAEISRYPIGYSGHEQGLSVCIGAVAMGAKVIERHLTLDRSMPGPDHKASLEPEEFAELVKQIRITEASLGEPARYISRGEYLNRESLSKSLVVTRDIKQGEILDYSDIELKSPGQGTSPLKINYFIGHALVKRDLKKDDYLLESDIGGYVPIHDLRGLKINHKWGVVARMSDIEKLLPCQPDFVEIHLTDSDINMDKEYDKSYDVDLVVHGPEYNGNLLIDLSCLDDSLRRQSIDFFNIALAHARKLKKLFKNRDQLVRFVVHPGGMNMDKPMIESVDQLNRNLLDSLNKLKAEGFELLIENMPSCPWYFGGQWFHGSFMDAKEIVKFSRETGYGIIFDVSHAALYCNYYKKDFEEYVRTILPATKYVHIADAAGFNGEGLRIGDGSVDFKMLLRHLVETDLWFLPEIWQGHKFGGEDFVVAIRNLKLINQDF